MSFLKKRVLLSCFLAVGVSLCAFALPVSAQPDLPQAEAGETARPMTQHSFLVSPNGQFVAGIVNKLKDGEASSAITLWEVASGRVLWHKTSPANFGVQGFFSPDGKRVVCHGIIPGPQDGGVAKSRSIINIWSVDSGEELLALKLPEGEGLHNLAFTPDGERLLGVLLRAPGEGRPRFVAQEWDGTTGKLLKAIEDKPQLAVQGSWLAVEGRLLTNSLVRRRGEGAQGVRGKFHIWSLPELQLLHSLDIGEDVAYTRTLSPDGKRAAFALFRREEAPPETYLWNTDEEKPRALTFAEGFESSVSDFQFTPDSQTLIGVVNYRRDEEVLSEIRFWDAQTAQTKRTLRIPLMRVREWNTLYSVRLFPDSKQFILIGGSGIIELRNLEDGELIRTFEERKQS